MRGDLQEGNGCASRCQSISFRAQNRGFCALFAFGTLVFSPFEQKIGVFVRFWGMEPHFPAFQAQNQHFCAREEGDWHQGKRKLASGSITMGFLQITAHVSKTQMSHNQIINFFEHFKYLYFNTLSYKKVIKKARVIH